MEGDRSGGPPLATQDSRAILMPSDANLRRRPCEVEVTLMTTPFWFRR
jgi:hypothetical protein